MNQGVAPIQTPLIQEKVNILNIFSYLIMCIWRGITYIIKDLPITLWRNLSGHVDNAYRETKESVSVSAKKKSGLLSMDINDLFANSKYNQNRIAKLEKEKVNLLKDLEGEGAVRSKEPRIFQYTAKTPDGKIETDTMPGLSKLDINTFLVQAGYDVYKIENNKFIDVMYGDTGLFATKMSTKDLLFWLTQLSTYLKSGIPLAESINILNHQMSKQKKYKKGFQSIVYELTMGEAFSAALEKQGTMFPALLINMVRAAEATGQLEETLEDMAAYYEEIDKTRKQMISAMTYPTVITIFAIGVVTFILVYVIPQFVDMYEQAGAELNGLTLFIVRASKYLQENWLNLLLTIVIIIVVIAILYKKVKAFRKGMQTFLMKLPVIGNIIKYNEMTIFTKTFASLLRNNVFITESIDILSKITNNEIYKEIMYDTINNIVKGEKISLAFQDHWAVPDVAYYMIVTGESTGQLAEMMSKVSVYYQELHRNAVGSLKAFIEPIMIAVLAIVTGGILLAVIVPMFGIMQTVQ